MLQSPIHSSFSLDCKKEKVESEAFTDHVGIIEIKPNKGSQQATKASQKKEVLALAATFTSSDSEQNWLI